MNTNVLKNVAIFIMGAGVGFASSMIYFRKKYEKLEELAELKIQANAEMYERKLNRAKDKKKEETPVETKEEIEHNRVEYDKIIKQNAYVEKEAKNKMGLPHVIDRDEYGEIEEYDIKSLTYYADGVLENDADGKLIEDIDYHIGYDSLEEFEDDALFVRNDDTKTDYEIIRVDESYYG